MPVLRHNPVRLGHALRARARRVSPTQMALAIGASPDVATDATASAATIGSVTRGLYDVDAEQLRPVPTEKAVLVAGVDVAADDGYAAGR
jgi:hypothetical protein